MAHRAKIARSDDKRRPIRNFPAKKHGIRRKPDRSATGRTAPEPVAQGAGRTAFDLFDQLPRRRPGRIDPRPQAGPVNLRKHPDADSGVNAETGLPDHGQLAVGIFPDYFHDRSNSSIRRQMRRPAVTPARRSVPTEDSSECTRPRTSTGESASGPAGRCRRAPFRPVGSRCLVRPVRGELRYGSERSRRPRASHTLSWESARRYGTRNAYAERCRTVRMPS